MTTIPTFEEKVSILTQLLLNADQETIAEAFNTTVEQVERIGENHLKIMEVCHYLEQSKYIELRGGHYPRMEKVLFYWLGQQTMNVTNKALAAKAKSLIDILSEIPTARNVPVFTGSRNWVNAFKNRYGILRTTTNSNTETENSSTANEVDDADTDNNDRWEELPAAPKFDEADKDNNDRWEELPAAPKSDEADKDNNDRCEELPAAPKSDEADKDNNDRWEELPAAPKSDEADKDNNDRWEELPAAPKSDEADKDNNDRWEELPAAPKSDEADKDNNDRWEELPAAPKFDDADKDNNDRWEELPAAKKSRKRKGASVTVDDDEDGDGSRKKKFNIKLLMPSRKNVVKSVNLVDYLESQVVKAFEPVLKLAKESGWCQEDKDSLNRLYAKSLKKCNAKTKQAVITQYFKKKK